MTGRKSIQRKKERRKKKEYKRKILINISYEILMIVYNLQINNENEWYVCAQGENAGR